MSQTRTKSNTFLVEGVGKDSIPGCMDFSVIDDVIQVTDEQSFQTCHQLARKEGLMVGGSAGLNTWAAIQVANQLEVQKSFKFRNKTDCINPTGAWCDSYCTV